MFYPPKRPTGHHHVVVNCVGAGHGVGIGVFGLEREKKTKDLNDHVSKRPTGHHHVECVGARHGEGVGEVGLERVKDKR